jgi:site-specific DNA recombinase
VISEEDAKQRIAELKEERLRVEAELATLEEAPVPIALHPATLDRYIKTVSHAGAEDDRGSLIDDFRTLVHSVIVHPNGPWQGFEVEVKGKLAALVGGELFPQAHHNSGSRVVAGDYYIATSTNDNALFHRRLLRRYPVGMRNKLE